MAATGVSSFNFTGIAGENLTNQEYRAVNYNANGQVVLAAAGGRSIGILQMGDNVGRPVTIMKTGISIVRYGAPVLAGADLASDAVGDLVPAVPLDVVVGYANAAGAAGEYHSALLK